MERGLSVESPIGLFSLKIVPKDDGKHVYKSSVAYPVNLGKYRLAPSW